MSFRSKLYRTFCRSVLKTLTRISPQLSRRFYQSHEIERMGAAFFPPLSSQKRIWFHAASAGELESLVSVIEQAAQSGFELIVTIMSPSAEKALAGLAERLRKNAARLIYIGYSPLEGGWEQALVILKPHVFVTAKYEAWPDLWMSLSVHQTPLVIVGAQPRSSLKWAKRICGFSGVSLPSLHLGIFDEQKESLIRGLFPKAEIKKMTDPRWDRIFARAQKGAPLAQEWIERAMQKNYPKPWGVLAQVWPEDLQAWSKNLSQLKGTLWIVPHSLESKNLAALRALLPADQSRILFVDVMGVLLELYSAMDWAYVGGGFSSGGVHSTAEPAIHGIPICCGPNRAHLFYEIEELKRSGQLSVLSSQDQIPLWLSKWNLSSRNPAWRRDAELKVGGGKHALEWIAQLSATPPHATL